MCSIVLWVSIVNTKMVANSDVIYMLEKAYIEAPQEKEVKEVKKIGLGKYQYR